MLISLVFLFYSQQSNAMMDFLGEQAKEASEVAAYTDALIDLAGEITDSESLEENSKEYKKRIGYLKSEISNVSYLSSTSKNLLNGPDWSSHRIDENIKATTNYIKRFKRIIARAAILGTDGATALNTAETNVALNEIQKNQQTIMLQNQDFMLRSLEKEKEEASKWNNFVKNQKEARSQNSVGGFRD